MKPLAQVYDPATWITRDGREVPISHMDDAHLLNTVRMLFRNGRGISYPPMRSLLDEVARRRLMP